MKGIRILLADDHEIVRRGVQSMLEREEDMEIVGDCSSAEEALFLTEITLPNIILTGAKLPGIGGFEVARRLHQKRLPCNVIILTMYEDYLAEALEAGVAGYLLEDIKCQELVQAIRRVYHGELVIDERLASTPQIEEGESEYPLPEDDSALCKEAELIIPLPFDAAQLLRFMYQVEEMLGATIVQQAGSWNRDTAITILLRRAAPLVDILDRLGKMSDVDGVIEKPAAKYNLLSFSRKIIAKPETRPRKQLLVTLKQASPAEQSELTGQRINQSMGIKERRGRG